MEISNNLIYTIGIFLIVVFVGNFALSGEESSNIVNKDYNGEFQVVKLSVLNGDYILEPSEIKKDVPVRVEADMANMPGCSRAIVIPAFEASKLFTSNFMISGANNL